MNREKTDRSDTDIARAAVAALTWNRVVPPDRIMVTVANGWVTLYGTLEWYEQMAAAEHAVRNLPGVRGVSSAIVLQAPAEPGEEGRQASCVEAAAGPGAGRTRQPAP